MTPAAGALLQLLGSGVNLLSRAAGPKAPVEGASFDDLLSRARDGSLREGEPIKIGSASQIELTPDQIERLGEAATALERAGASRAVVMIDDIAIEYDVQGRTVIGEIDLSSGDAVTGVDAFVRAPAEAGAGAVLTSPAFARTPSESLLRALGEGSAA